MRPHEERRLALDALALLVGFPPSGEVRELPDGSQPDVLRVDVARRRLFVADAKDVETPGNAATMRRLARYISWVAAANAHGIGVLAALCHGDPWHAQAWAKALGRLARDADLSGTVEIEVLSADAVLAWMWLPPAKMSRAWSEISGSDRNTRFRKLHFDARRPTA